MQPHGPTGATVEVVSLNHGVGDLDFESQSKSPCCEAKLVPIVGQHRPHIRYLLLQLVFFLHGAILDIGFAKA